MEFVARPYRFEPDHVNGQWLSYLDFVVEDGEYPQREDHVIVFTGQGAFDAVVEDIDSRSDVPTAYYIIYIAPINESIDLTGKVA